MENILLIFICLFLGIMLRKIPDFPANGFKVLNQFIIYASLPALTLFYMPKIVFSSDLWILVAVPWVGFGLSYLFFSLLGNWLRWPGKLVGCLIITAGLGNTSFIGFPVIQTLYGDAGLQGAILLDQAGSFLILATVATITAVIFSKGAVKPMVMLGKIAVFPPFLAFAIGLGLCLLHADFLEPVQKAMRNLGATTVPIAMVSVGLQLTIQRRTVYWRHLFFGLLFKLVITPAVFYLVYRFGFGLDGLNMKVAVMEAAMAPMITGAILAASYGLKPKLAGMMIGFGIPLSFVTMAFWYLIVSA